MPRVAFASLVYHIVSRGNNRERIFSEVQDIYKKYRQRPFRQEIGMVLFLANILMAVEVNANFNWFNVDSEG